jgi:hypothetical protein
VGDGERFRSGETLQIGWMPTTLERGDADSLWVTEANLKSMPARFIDSVDRTVKHLRNRNDQVGGLSPWQPEFPSLRQSAVVHVGYRSASRLLLTGDRARETGSGWSVTDRDDSRSTRSSSSNGAIQPAGPGSSRPQAVGHKRSLTDRDVRPDMSPERPSQTANVSLHPGERTRLGPARHETTGLPEIRTSRLLIGHVERAPSHARPCRDADAIAQRESASVMDGTSLCIAWPTMKLPAQKSGGGKSSSRLPTRDGPAVFVNEFIL